METSIGAATVVYGCDEVSSESEDPRDARTAVVADDSGGYVFFVLTEEIRRVA